MFDPDLGVPHHQVIIVIHERSALLLLIEAVEPGLVEVEQKRPLDFLVELLLQWMLGEDSDNCVCNGSDQDEDVGFVVDVVMEVFFVVEVLGIDLRGLLDGKLGELLNFLRKRLLAFVSDTAEDVSVEVFIRGMIRNHFFCSKLFQLALQHLDLF